MQRAAASFELTHPPAKILLRSGEPQVAERRERVHHRDEIVGGELPDEILERAAHPKRDIRLLVDVIVVEENREDPHIITRRLECRVLRRADLERVFEVRRPRPVEPDELHGLHGLQNTILDHLEVGGLEIGDRLIVTARHRHVHAYDIDPALEDWRRLLSVLDPHHDRCAANDQRARQQASTCGQVSAALHVATGLRGCEKMRPSTSFGPGACRWAAPKDAASGVSTYSEAAALLWSARSWMVPS